MSTKYFQIKTCPLCSKTLKLYFDGKVTKYYCQEFFYRNSTGYEEYQSKAFDKHAQKIREPHYSVIFEGSSFMQSTIVLPYWIKTIGGEGRSKIYKFPPKDRDPFASLFNSAPTGYDTSDLIMEIPVILPSDYLPEQFAKKIKNLVIFT